MIKNILIGVVVVAAFIIVGLSFSSHTTTPLDINTPSPSPSVEASPSPVATATKTPQPSSAPAATLSYASALKLYAGYRIQFGPSVATNYTSCVTGANSLTFKNNTKVMLDNRSAVTSKIKIGGVIYSLAPYQFRIITLSSGTLPITYGVDCNQYQNVVSIQLQK